MQYHIALIPPCNLEGITENALAGKCPNHVIWAMSQLLGATVYQPGCEPVLPIDQIRAHIIGRPEYWALARKLPSQLQEDDVIYCTGEHIGIPIATLCAAKQKRPKIVVYIHNINRPRSRLALKLFNIANRIDLFVTTVASQAEFLRHYLRLPENRVYLFLSQPIDTSFFTPGPALQNKLRPVIASGGLEKRDYRTLADATRDLNVDVKICAFSRNAVALKRAFPEVMPGNMSCGFYDWCELVQLYRDSDLVVITLFENNYEAGLTTLFEAIACRRPVVITRSSGIIGDLIDSGIVTGVNPGDPVELRQAILNLLNAPEKAQAHAQRGYELVLNQFNHVKYTQALVTKLISTFGSINKKSFSLL
ncbi:MAG: glycosyltransferase family 4 protein [Scytonema hyalinum WJT4-NPBG1]|nr:glycosyltransferase family 4 protein [Scytonema hyalinum WJT4-NPBG1]